MNYSFNFWLLISAVVSASGICGKNETIIINSPYAKITFGFVNVCQTAGIACDKALVMAAAVANVSSLSNSSPTIRKPIMFTKTNSTTNHCTPVVSITLTSISVKIITAEAKAVCAPKRNEAKAVCAPKRNEAKPKGIEAKAVCAPKRNESMADCVDLRKLVAVSTPPDRSNKLKIVKYTTAEADIPAITKMSPEESQCLMRCVVPCSAGVTCCCCIIVVLKKNSITKNEKHYQARKIKGPIFLQLIS